jgi:protein gp37
MLPNGWLMERTNVWLGASVINQVEADRDIPKLVAQHAAVKFLSMEPLLGPVDLLGNLPEERALRWHRPKT